MDNSVNLSKTVLGFVVHEVCSQASLSVIGVCLPRPFSYQCTCMYVYTYTSTIHIIQRYTVNTNSILGKCTDFDMWDPFNRLYTECGRACAPL